MKNPILVSVAWGAEFMPLADRLERIAEALGLEAIIDRVPGEPENALEAWKRKPASLLGALLSGRPALFLDVDSVVYRSISELADLDCDLGAYSSRPGVWEDGVLLVQPTDKARAVLELWDRKCDRLMWMKNPLDPRRWTNLALSEAINELRPNVANLGPQYCFNEFWGMSERFPGVRPVIQPNVKLVE